MAFDLDAEVRIRIAVDIALDDGEVTVGARHMAHGQLPGCVNGPSETMREGV